jgi:ankyrin repeat protein
MRIQLLKRFIALGADVSQKDRDGNDALIYAVSFGLSDIAELLIAHGADVRVTNNAGLSPLHFCESEAIAELLVSHGAPPDLKTKSGETPIDFAIRKGNTNIVLILMGNGAKRQTGSDERPVAD